MEVDRISNLPSVIIEDILLRLPIKEAVKTSVLSRKWMNKSAMLRFLNFDDQLLLSGTTTIAKIIDHMLLLHIGPIHRFMLWRSELVASSDIDRWIYHLSRNNIKELILFVCRGPPYKMPSRLFSCDDLVQLELFNCVLEPPTTFEGFKSLKRLFLLAVTVAQDVLEKMIVCSPLLERLTFLYSHGLSNLKIDAPNLQYLELKGDFQDVTFENTSNKLTDVSIDLTADVDKTGLIETSSNLVKLFAHLPSIQRLSVMGYFLKYLAVGALPDKLPTPCMSLQFLSLTIRLNNPVEIFDALCLLRSFPALRKLQLQIWAKKEDHSVVEGENSLLDGNENCLFPQLQYVEVTGISAGGVQAELDLIRYLLSNSPLLKKMTVKPACADDFKKLFVELLRFRRASAYAEIIYLDP